MPHAITRRAALTGLAAGTLSLMTARTAGADPGPAADPHDPDGLPSDLGDVAVAAVAHAGFRVVRETAGTPSTPQILLPAGYTPTPGDRYQVASRAEFYSFVQGERSDDGIEVSVRWPGVPVAAVVAGERRLELRRDPADPDTVTFTLPVFRASPTADSGTIQVWSHLSGAASGEYWAVAHNDPDRVAGVWTTVAWPGPHTRAVITYMLACHEILHDSGMIARARARGHFFALMGFETNNVMHADNPPHWHMSYYPGPDMDAPRQTIPHYWVNAQGQTYYNGQDVQGQGRTQYRVGNPAPIYDAEGGLVVTTTIRADGGLDIDPADGPRYSITSPDATYTGSVHILRAGRLWRICMTHDDYRAGVLRTDALGVRHDPTGERVEYRYDPLTGALQGIRRF